MARIYFTNEGGVADYVDNLEAFGKLRRFQRSQPNGRHSPFKVFLE